MALLDDEIDKQELMDVVSLISSDVLSKRHEKWCTRLQLSSHPKPVSWWPAVGTTGQTALR
jgi:hypothetical protein